MWGFQVFTTMMSASLPTSIEPIRWSSPSALAPSIVAISSTLPTGISVGSFLRRRWMRGDQ